MIPKRWYTCKMWDLAVLSHKINFDHIWARAVPMTKAHLFSVHMALCQVRYAISWSLMKFQDSYAQKADFGTYNHLRSLKWEHCWRRWYMLFYFTLNEPKSWYTCKMWDLAVLGHKINFYHIWARAVPMTKAHLFSVHMALYQVR